MKRNKIFGASIINIVANVAGMLVSFISAFVIGYLLFILFALIFNLNEGETLETDATILVFVLFVGVATLLLLCAVGNLVALILSVFSLKTAKLPLDVFAKKKKVVVATIVFDFLLIFGSLVSGALSIVAVGGYGLIIVGMFFATVIALLVSAILMIVDLKQEKVRVAQQNAENPQVVEVEITDVNVESESVKQEENKE